MANEGLRRNLERAFDGGPDFPHRTLLSRSMAMLDAEPRVRRGTRPLSVVVLVGLFLVAAYGLLQLHTWYGHRSIPASPTPSPGSFTVRQGGGWVFSANDAAVPVYATRPVPGPLAPSELEITHDGGRTWLRTGIKNLPELNLKWLDSQHIVIVGGHVGPPYVVEATSDGGSHWQSITITTEIRPALTSFRDTSEGWTLSCTGSPCSSYAIKHTVDSGAHWQELTNSVTLSNSMPSGMSFTDSEHGFMSTLNGDGVGRLF